MTTQEWNKYERHLTNTTRCPVCGKRITAYEAGVAYIKTKRGTHIFAHEECIGQKGGSDD